MVSAKKLDAMVFKEYFFIINGSKKKPAVNSRLYVFLT